MSWLKVTTAVAGPGFSAAIAGGIAAKTGLLAKLVALAVAGKKFVVLVLAGFGALLRRLLCDHGLMTRTRDGRIYRRIEQKPPAEAVALIRALAPRLAA